MKDPLFGELGTIDHEDGKAWLGSVQLKYFRGCGGELSLEPDDDGEQQHLPQHPPGYRSQRSLAREKQFQDLIDSGQGSELSRAMIEAERNKAYGTAKPKREKTPEDRDDERLFAALCRGKVELLIETTASMHAKGFQIPRPTPAQQQAWQKLLKRGDAMWDEMMRKVLAEYKLQRPARVRWWSAMYGKYRLARATPTINTIQALRKYVVPCNVKIMNVAADARQVDIGLKLLCVWDEEGVGVLMRDGKITALGNGQLVFPFRDWGSIHVREKTLGALRRLDEKSPWRGITRCEPLRDYFDIAVARGEFLDDPVEWGRVRWPIPTDFARGDFDLYVYAPAGEPPTAAQVKALQQFRKNEKKFVPKMIDAIFAYYRENRDRFRKERGGWDVEHRAPDIGDPSVLKQHMTFQAIHILPERKGKPVALGFLIGCSWGNRWMGVRWRDGAVEAIGPEDVASTDLGGGKGRS